MLKSLTQKLICINLAPAQGSLWVGFGGHALVACCDGDVQPGPRSPCGARIKIQIVVLRTDPYSSDLTTHCIGRNDYSLLTAAAAAAVLQPFPREGSFRNLPACYPGFRALLKRSCSFLLKVVNVYGILRG